MRVMRPGLLLLAAGQLVTGGWALAAPAHFYARFPGVRTGWVAADGPFNHHLVLDAGSGFAATGVALVLAALWPRRHVLAVALGAYLVHAVPHLVYHVRHPSPTLPEVDQVLSWVPLAAGAALAAGLLVTALRAPVSPIRPTAPAPSAGSIAPLDGRPRNPLLLVAFAAARRRLGTVPASWRILARVPRTALARVVADAAHERTRMVPAPIGTLAMLRTATLVDCAFCIDILSASARSAGVRPEQVRELARWRESAAFDEDERRVLALADAMTATPTRVPADLVADLAARFGTAGVVELAAGIGHENARARANRVFGVAPQGFAAAASCPLPEPAPSRPLAQPSRP